MPTGASKLDEFESMFRSALHEVFHYEPPVLERVLVVSDLEAAATDALVAGVRQFLTRIDGASGLTVEGLSRADWTGGDDPPIAQLQRAIAERAPHLVVTWRHLLGAHRALRHTLGSVVDTLTQGEVPVLLLPSESAEALAALDGTARVMVVTDRITGEDRLVSWAVHLTWSEGTLWLAHVEDDATLARYLEAIGQIRGIDSAVAGRELPAKLLDIPRGYLDTIRAALSKHVPERIVPVVKLGHALSDYRALADEHDIGLLVVSARDDRQAAMPGLAHALAVELRDRPVLLL